MITGGNESTGRAQEVRIGDNGALLVREEPRAPLERTYTTAVLDDGASETITIDARGYRWFRAYWASGQGKNLKARLRGSANYGGVRFMMLAGEFGPASTVSTGYTPKQLDVSELRIEMENAAGDTTQQAITVEYILYS